MSYLGIFAKFWQPGRVKTRLAKSLGEETASRVYRACAECVVQRFSATADRRGIWYAPPESESAFATLAGDAYEVHPQAEGDLGVRMEDFFRRSLTSHPAVLVGSDSPNLPHELVEQAFAALNCTDVVLGPSEDGGYYLVGAARAVPPIFADMPWSSSDVFEQTVRRLEVAGIAYSVLGPWYDVDECSDLERLRGDLAGQSSVREAALERLAASLDELLDA